MSDDPKWKDLLYIKYYFQGQTMPSILAWFLYQLPDVIQKSMSVITLIMECVFPFFILLPERFRRLRLATFFVFCGFMIFLSFTGNYGFFQLLVMVTCVALLNDSEALSIPILKSIPLRRSFYVAPRLLELRWKIGSSVAGILLLISSQWLTHMMARPMQFSMLDTTWLYQASPSAISSPFMRALYWLRHYNLSFPYDLFSHMSNYRFDFVVQGSMDNKNWKDYEFLYKTGKPNQVPWNFFPFVWSFDHMLFYKAAIEGIFYAGKFRINFQNPGKYTDIRVRTDNSVILRYYTFLGLGDLPRALLQGTPAVTCLFRVNPFPEAPPKYVRFLLYRTSFTDIKELLATGN